MTINNYYLMWKVIATITLLGTGAYMPSLLLSAAHAVGIYAIWFCQERKK